MKNKKPTTNNQVKQAIQKSLQDFQNRFNSQGSGTAATAYRGKSVSENRNAQRIHKVQNPK